MAVTGNIFGAIFTFVVFNILNQGMKWFGFRIGYTKGMEIINSGSGDEVIKKNIWCSYRIRLMRCRMPCIHDCKSKCATGICKRRRKNCCAGADR